MAYQPDFDLDLAYGEAAEAHVWGLLNMPQCRVEVKADRRYVDTGNVFVEVAQLPRGATEYKRSGIYVTQANYWAFSIGPAVSIIPTSVIRAVVSNQDGPPIDGGLSGDNPTKGYPISLRALLTISYQHGQPPGAT